ncbi:MAG: hypothetical protein HY445_01815 [Candidatus Niyogibacteria bacterium]|nr:hypothetical protein [Candidatus Niyogibacteria bacterium]
MFRDPLSRSRRLQRKRAYRRIIIFLGKTALVWIFFIGFLYIPYFRIDSPEVTRAKSMLPEEVQIITRSFLQEHIWGIIPRSNFFVFLFSQKTLSGMLRVKFPRIDMVRFKKSLPNRITIMLEERNTWSNLCNADSCFYSDEKGILFAPAPHAGGTIFFAIEDTRKTDYPLGSSFLPEEELEKMRTLFGEIEKRTGHKFKTLHIAGEELLKYEAETDKGLRVIFDSRTDIDFAVANFLTAYDGLLKEKLENIDYIDLRLENKVFYKYK